MLSDEELFSAWRGGDTGAGDAFVRLMFGPIRRFFASKAGSEVEELVQQTFARLLEAHTRFEGRSTARAFVFGVARNVLREYYRRRHGHVDVDDVPVCDMAAGPSTLRWRQREDALLLDALRKLPLRMQVALELYYWDDFSFREIATILEVPEGTIASRIRRAKLRLRDQFEGRHTPPDDEDGDGASLDAWSERIRSTVPLDGP